MSKQRPADNQSWAFERLSKIAEVRALSEEEQAQYEASLRHYRDTNAVMAYRYTEGLAEGHAKEKINVARAMLARGLDMALIHDVTQLPLEQISALAQHAPAKTPPKKTD